MRFIILALALLTAVPASATTQTVKQSRLRYALIMAGMPGARTDQSMVSIVNSYYYDTAVELAAASPKDGSFGYAFDTDVLWVRVAGSWVAIGSAGGILGSNGGTIGNETNNVWTFTENSENLTLTYAADLLTFASGTAATFVLTPATTITGILTLNGGASGLTMTAANSSLTVLDNSATGWVAGSSGNPNQLQIDTQTGQERIVVEGTTTVEAFRVDTGTAAFDEALTFPHGWETKSAHYTMAAPADCNKHFNIATDSVMVLLPAVATGNAGCCVTVHNTGSDDAALVGFSVNASDAVFGQVPNAAADVTASGTDDQAWTNDKSGANKGDWSMVCSDGSTGWFITGGVGVWSSQAQ